MVRWQQYVLNDDQNIPAYRIYSKNINIIHKCQKYVQIKLACLRRNSIAAGAKPMLDAQAKYGLIRKRAEYGNLRN